MPHYQPRIRNIDFQEMAFTKGSGYLSGTGQIASEANRPVPDE